MDEIEEKLKELKVSEHEYPDWYKEGEFDAFLVYHPTDRTRARVLKRELEQISLSNSPNHPKICTDDESCLYYTGLKRSEECFTKSTYTLLYITENFSKDFEGELMKEYAISDMILNPQKRWCLIPIVCSEINDSREMPFGLRGIKPLELVSNPNLIPSKTTEYFDEFSKKMFKRMVDNRRYLLQEREKYNEHKLKLWMVKKHLENKQLSNKKSAEMMSAMQSDEKIKVNCGETAGSNVLPQVVHNHYSYQTYNVENSKNVQIGNDNVINEIVDDSETSSAEDNDNNAEDNDNNAE